MGKIVGLLVWKVVEFAAFLMTWRLGEYTLRDATPEKLYAMLEFGTTESRIRYIPGFEFTALGGNAHAHAGGAAGIDSHVSGGAGATGWHKLQFVGVLLLLCDLCEFVVINKWFLFFHSRNPDSKYGLFKFLWTSDKLLKRVVVLWLVYLCNQYV